MAEPVIIGTSLQPTVRSRIEDPWRYEAPVGDGLLVSMYAIPDLTAPDVLAAPFHFQVPPLDSLAVQRQFNWTTWQTLRKGEFVSSGGRGLATISFNTLFVAYNASWTFQTNTDMSDRRSGRTQQAEAVVGHNPRSAANRLKAILNSGTPFGLVIGNHPLWGYNDVHWGPPNDNAAVLTALTVEERAGEPDARYTNVSFQEYRSPELERRRKGKKRNSNKRGRDVPAVVQVAATDTEAKRLAEGHHSGQVWARATTLYGLARHFYGSQAEWRLIVSDPANSKLKNVTPSRALGEWLSSRHEKSMKLRIPEPRKASINTPDDGE